MRCAFTMIWLCAACRNTSVRRTTGTAPDEMTSASTWPGPTGGSWSISPTIKSAALSGTAFMSACISMTSTMEVSSTTNRSQSSGLTSLRLKPPPLGSTSSSRWMVLASKPVASVMRLAARPVGPLIHGLGQRIGYPGADAHQGGLLDAELHRHGIGRLETDAADIARQAIRVLGHDLDGVRAVGLADAHRPRRADAVAVQEHHDFPHRLLLGPGRGDATGSYRPDAVDLTQSVRRRINNVEHFLAERAQEFLGVGRANASDHAGRKVFLDALGGGRRRCAQEPRLELLSVCSIVDPFA